MTAPAVPAGGGFTVAAVRSTGTTVTAGEVAAFCLGVTTWFEVRFLGRMYLGELGLAVCALALPIVWQRVRHTVEARRLFAWYVALFALYFAGLILTDLYRATVFSDFARGWARGLFLFTNTIGLLAIGYGRPRQLLAWVAGQAVSGLILVGIEYAQYGMVLWKFGLALPVVVGVLLVTDSRRTGRAVAVLLGLAAINLLLDYRSVAGFCCAAAIVVFYKRRRTKGSGLGALAASAVIAAAVGAGFLALYSSGRLLGDPTFGQDVFERRRGSNIERVAGLIIGVEAVRASPLIGYGSWARSSELFATWATIQEDLGSTMTAEQKTVEREEVGEVDIIPTHSQILQGWVEAGIPGMLFFLFLFIAVFRMLRRLIRRPGIPSSFALAAWWAIWTLWAIAMSPFGGPVRLHNAIAFALLFVLAFNRAARPGVNQARGTI